MRKQSYSLLMLLAFLAASLSAQTLQLPLDTDRLSSGNAIIQLPDTSLVYSNVFQSGSGLFGFGGLNATRVSVDTGLIWSKDFTYEQPANRSTIQHWPSEDALLLGSTLVNGFPYKVVSRLDLDGNVQWSRRFGSLTDFNNINLGRIDLVPEDNGTTVIAGGVQEIANSDGANDLYVARIDANGQVIWANNYCFSCLGRDAIFSDLLATQDGGYLITGAVNGTTINTGSANLLLMKIDGNGNLEWCNQYQSTAVFAAYTQVGRESVQLPNGNFVTAGFYDDFPSSVRDGLILEVDPNGSFERAVQVNIVGSSHEVTFNNLLALDNNTLVLPGGSEEDVLISESRVFNFLTQIQLDGTIDWAYNYFQEELLGFGTRRNDLIPLTDNRYGYLANDHQGFDALNPVLVITDENGQTGCEEPIELRTDPNVVYTVSPLSPTVQENLEAADYGLTVSDHTSFTIELPILELGLDTAFCRDFTLPLDATVDVPATYSWSTGESSAIINATEPGLYEVTVTATDLCVQLVDSVLIDQLDGPMQSVDTVLCPGQSIVIGGTSYDSTGIFTAFLPGPVCDTMINLNLTVLPGVVTNIDTLICEGTSLMLGGETYTEAGTYVQTFSSSGQCDSTVNINLGFFPAPPSLITTGAVNCADNTVILNATTGSAWQWSTGANSGSIDALAPGSYLLTLTDDNGCSRQDSLTLEPIPEDFLDLAVVSQSNYQGFAVSCADATDGDVTIAASGGQAPYTFQWNTGATSASLSELAAGLYTVTATDNNGCSGTESLQLEAPESIVFDLASSISGCPGFENGSIAVIDLSGGTGTITYVLNDEFSQTSPQFDGLLPGNYTVNVIDANGCAAEQTVFLPELVAPVLDLGPDASIELGETFQIRGQTTLSNIAQFEWTPETELDCLDCLDPVVAPLETTVYELTLTDSLGCTISSSIQIRVTKDRAIFIPNAFSPNNDGANDRFVPYPGPSVDRIDLLQVYDRWGALVYESDTIGLGGPEAGWDGQIGGEQAAIGVYVFMLRVRFIDGEETVLSGDVTLVR